jgi:hypothetical protein
VVRHFEEAGRERFPRRRDRFLRGVLEISGQEGRLPSPREAQRQRVVVADRPRRGARSGGIQHREPHSLPGQVNPAARPHDRRSNLLRRLFRSGVTPISTARIAQPQRLGAEGAENRRSPAQMIAVRVRHHEEIELQDPQGPQRRRHDPRPHVEVVAGPPSRIDEDGAAARQPHQDGVPLADVEHDDLQAAVRPHDSSPQDEAGPENRQECRACDAPGGGTERAEPQRREAGGRHDAPRRRLDEDRSAWNCRAGGGARAQRRDERRGASHKRRRRQRPHERQRRRQGGEQEEQ